MRASYQPYITLIKKPTNTRIKCKSQINNPQYLVVSYINIEKLIYSNSLSNNKHKNFFIIWTTWSTLICVNNVKVQIDKIKIDPILYYFINLFALIIQLQKVENNHLWHNYTTRANYVYFIAKQPNYFNKTNIVSIRGRFAYLNIIDQINQTDLVPNSLFSTLKKTYKKANNKKNKYKRVKLVSQVFSKLIKKTHFSHINPNFHLLVTLNRVKVKAIKQNINKDNRFLYPIPSTVFKIKTVKFTGIQKKHIKKNKYKKNKYKKNKFKTNLPTTRFSKKKYITKPTITYKKSFSYKLCSTQYNESFIYGSNTNQIKNRISLLSNSTFIIYKVNALSLTRFNFELERRAEIKANPLIVNKKKSSNFLKQLQIKLEIRYRYVAKYIKDLVRITFCCLFLKKAKFLANFYAFRLNKLPRKRKETKLIYFIITVLKRFSTQRPEILGVRFRVQGRLNRWRRTKNITGQKGYLDLYSYNSRIEFGRAQAITRKGTQGIRIWICYNQKFSVILKKAIFNYRILNSIKQK